MRIAQGKGSISEKPTAFQPRGSQATDAASMPEQTERKRMGLVLVDDVDEARAVGEGEDVGGQCKTGEEGEEEFHGLLVRVGL